MSGVSLLAQMSPYYNDSYTYSTNTVSDAEAAGFTVLVFLIIGAVAIITYVVSAIFTSMIFKKAGEDGWKAWVPFYNNWVLLELGGQKGYWAVLALVPFVNIASMVFMYIAMYNIGLNLKKEGTFVLLAIFLPLVWVIWLGVDKSTWQGDAAPTSKPTPPAPTASSTPTPPSAPIPPTPPAMPSA